VLLGVVIDRDMHIALATQNARASRRRVGAWHRRSWRRARRKTSC
jgi:hypothetical protein